MTANVLKGYYGYCGQGHSGRLCRKNMEPRALSIDVLANGLPMGYWKRCGMRSWPSCRRKSKFAGTNVLWTVRLPAQKKGPQSRQNQTRQGNEAYGIG